MSIKQKRTLPKRRGALVPGRLQNPCLHFFCLPFSKAAALSLAHSPGSVSQDRDPLCTALMIVVIQAVQNVAVHLKPGFRRLKQVFEQASAVFLKASAAGITAFPGRKNGDRDSAGGRGQEPRAALAESFFVLWTSSVFGTGI